MTDEVEQDLSDFSPGHRWIKMWQTMFFVLDCIVMIVSIGLNLCLLRAVAKHPHKETAVYFALIFFFFTGLVDDAIIIEHFMTMYGHQVHTTSVCRLFTFATLGNRLLQAFSVLALLYYSWLMMEFKMTRLEQQARQYFPIAILALFVLEVVFTLPPTWNVRGSANGMFCLYRQDDITTIRRTGWLYQVLFPYYAPLLLAVLPTTKILLKLRERGGVTDRVRSQNQMVLCVCVGFFFFHLLYYLLMLGREIESLILDKSKFREWLGWYVWYITRPMFGLIGLGWHIIVPLSPFVFDTELLHTFPGPYVNKNKKMLMRQQQDTRDAISLEETPGGNDDSNEVRMKSDDNLNQVTVHREAHWTEIQNPLHNPDEEREFHPVPL